MTIARPLHVLIAGGGLSGLALAQGLIKDGHTCTVFERDADDSRKIGYYLHMNADGGEALRRCLPGDLFELYAETSRRTYDRRESIVLDDQLRELSSQPHLGPPNEGDRPHTGVHRRTLRAILRARLGESFRPGQAVTGYEETPDGVSVTLADGSAAEGDVLVGADGIRSAVRRQRLPGTTVIDAGIRGLGVYGRTPLTPGLLGQLPPHLFDGVIIAADRAGSRLLIAVYRPRQRPGDAAAAIAPDVELDPVDDYVMISCSVAPGTVIPAASEWTAGTPAMLRDAMLRAIEGWHPAARALVAGVDLDSIFVIPFGFLAGGALGALAGHPDRRRRPRDAPDARPGCEPRAARRRAPARPAVRRRARRGQHHRGHRRLRAGHARLRLPVHADDHGPRPAVRRRGTGGQ